MHTNDNKQIIEALRQHLISRGLESILRPCYPIEVHSGGKVESFVPQGFVVKDALGVGKDIEVEEDVSEVTIYAPGTHWHLDNKSHISYGIEILEKLLEEFRPST